MHDMEGKPRTGRRRLFAILATSGLSATAPLTVREWARPVVKHVLLPAHATSSPGSRNPAPDPIPPSPQVYVLSIDPPTDVSAFNLPCFNNTLARVEVSGWRAVVTPPLPPGTTLEVRTLVTGGLDPMQNHVVPPGSNCTSVVGTMEDTRCSREFDANGVVEQSASVVFDVSGHGPALSTAPEWAIGLEFSVPALPGIVPVMVDIVTLDNPCAP